MMLRYGKRKLSVGNKSSGPLARRAAGVVARRVASGAIKRLATGVVPYAGTAIRAARTGYRLYKTLRPGTRGRKSYGSSPNSKSKGYFPKTKKVTTKSDVFSSGGYVFKGEYGGVVVETGRQVVYLAHSTMPAQQVGRVFIAALVKKILVLANHTIKNSDEPILNGQYYKSELVLEYKVRDGTVVSEQKFVINTTDTLFIVTDQIFQWFMLLAESANLPSQYLSLKYYVEFGTLATARLLQAEIDLTTVSFEFYSKSLLKIQNRTINSSGNDQADDVDNVPIEGKCFDYISNGTIYRDYNTPASNDVSAITTHPIYGLLPSTIASDVGTGMYEELPNRTQFVGCKKTARSHLDPGEIKTSVLNDRLVIGMGKLITKLFARKPNTGSTGRFQQTWIGRTRLFGWEKMINAVAMTETNQFNLAFEHQLEIGCLVKVKRSIYTAPEVKIATGMVVN